MLFFIRVHHVLLSEMRKTQAIALCFIEDYSLKIEELEGQESRSLLLLIGTIEKDALTESNSIKDYMKLVIVQVPELEGGEMISACSEHRDLLIHWLTF